MRRSIVSESVRAERLDVGQDVEGELLLEDGLLRARPGQKRDALGGQLLDPRIVEGGGGLEDEGDGFAYAELAADGVEDMGQDDRRGVGAGDARASLGREASLTPATIRGTDGSELNASLRS